MRALSLCLIVCASSLGGCARLRLWRGGDSCATVEGCAQRLEDEAAVGRCRYQPSNRECDPLVEKMAGFGAAAEPFATTMLSSWDPDVVNVGAAIFARLERPSPGSLDALIAAVERRRGREHGASFPSAAEAIAKAGTAEAFAWLEQELEAGRCEVVKPLAGVGTPGREILLRSRNCCYFVGLALRPHVDAGVVAHYETELEGNGELGCLLQTIAELGPPAAPLEQALRRATKDEPAETYRVLRALGIRRGLSELAPAYVQAAPSRWRAFRSLAELGREGRSLVPWLSQVLEGENLEDRAAVAFALGFFGDPAATAPLERVARDGAAWVAGVEAVHALARLDTAASRAIVADVARTHWFSFVRREAERVLTARGRGLLDGLPPVCRYEKRHSNVPLATRVATGEQVALGGRTQPSVPVEEGMLVAVRDGRAGVVLRDAKNNEQVLWRWSVRGLVHTPAHVYAIGEESMTGADIPSGPAIVRLTRDADDKWTAVLAVQVPGSALAWGVDRRGALIVAATRGVFALLPDGTIAESPCDSLRE